MNTVIADLIETNLTYINNIFKKKFPDIDIITDFTYVEQKKCSFFNTKKNKLCNKKIKTDNLLFCIIHDQITTMIHNNITKNENICDNNIREYVYKNKTYYIDFFDNVYKLDENNEELFFVGLIDDEEVITFIN